MSALQHSEQYLTILRHGFLWQSLMKAIVVTYNNKSALFITIANSKNQQIAVIILQGNVEEVTEFQSHCENLNIRAANDVLIGKNSVLW